MKLTIEEIKALKKAKEKKINQDIIIQKND